MNSPSSTSRFAFAFAVLLLASSALGQGTVPKFLFVANYIDGTISVFRVQPLTGQLTQIPGSPFAGGTAIQGIALTPDKKFLYTSGINVTAFSVNQQTGGLTQIGAYPLVEGSGGLTITPNGKFAYSTGNGIFGFSIDSSTGALTPVPNSPFQTSVAFSSAAADPSSQYLYATTLIPSGINAYSIQEDGSLFTLEGSPYSDPNSPFAVAAEPSGRFVYVANYGGDISGYSIAAGQGTLTSLPGSPYSTGGQAPNAIAASSDGRAVVVDNQAQSTTASLGIQPDGSLVLEGTPQPAGFNPRGITVDPTSEFVYTASNNASTVSAYRLDPVSLQLGPVPGDQWATGSNPYALTVLAGANPPYCPLNNVEPSVTICAPATSSPSPVRIVAGTTSASAVQDLTVLVDGVKTLRDTGSEAMNAFVDVQPGEHTLVVQGQNAAGQEFSATRIITVSGSDTAGCSSDGIAPAVTVCTPLAGAVTGNEIHVIAQSVGFGVISSTAVYLDGVEVYSVANAEVNTYLEAATGTHQITVQSIDSNGFVWSSAVRVAAE